MRSVQTRVRYKVAPHSTPFFMSSCLGGTFMYLTGGGID